MKSPCTLLRTLLKASALPYQRPRMCPCFFDVPHLSDRMLCSARFSVGDEQNRTNWKASGSQSMFCIR